MNFVKFLAPFTRRVANRSTGRVVCVALSTTGLAGVAYTYTQCNSNGFRPKFSFPLMATCAAKVNPQGTVISDTKNHALYLTIHLKPGASTQACLKVLGQLQKYVDAISPPDMRDESDEIWFGVGFGPEFLDRLKPDCKPAGLAPYAYKARSGPLGDMPSTGGDIFIHAKCNERGKLFELCQAVINEFPAGSVAKFEDIYGWVYRNGRDLSGFIDGTENPADEDDRIRVAIDPKTQGSYVITQKWVHNHDVIRSTKDDVKSQWIGRQIEDSTELKKKSVTAHVSRMVGSAELDAPAKFQIVRHSQPYGTVSGDSGLFFIAYSATPVALDWMLDRMTGHGEDKKADDVMRMTSCVTGQYWFFPSQPDLERILRDGAGSSSFWGLRR